MSTESLLGSDNNTFLLGFRIENKLVNLIGKDGKNIPLFPASQLNSYNKEESLRHAIECVMLDLDPDRL